MFKALVFFGGLASFCGLSELLSRDIFASLIGLTSFVGRDNLDVFVSLDGFNNFAGYGKFLCIF